MSFISDTRPWSIFKCFSHQFWVDFFGMKARPCCQCSCWSGSTTSASSAYACAWRWQYDWIWAKKWFKKSCSFLLPPWRELKCLAGMGCSPHPHSSLAPKHIAKVRCLRWAVNTLTFQLNSNSFDIPLTVSWISLPTEVLSTLASSSWTSSSRQANWDEKRETNGGAARIENHLQWFAVGFFGICLDYMYIIIDYNIYIYIYIEYCRCCFLEGYSGV